MKKISLFTVLILFVLAFSTVGHAAKTYTISLGHGVMENHPTHFGALRLQKLVAERSNGRMEIKIYPNRQLGEEREMVEGIQMGTFDIAVVSTGPLGGFVPQINVVDLPFLFKNNIHAYGVLDGPIGRELLNKFSKAGIYGAAFWENGWRNLTASKAIRKPGDLKGIKIRTMENKVHMDSFKELGAGPTPMVWGEVYTSLKQGVIDAQENPYTVIYTNNLWEVQDYVMETGHFYSPHIVLVSQKTLDKLPDDLKNLLINSIQEATTYQRMKSNELSNDMKQKLLQKGIEILEVNKEPFQQEVMPVYKKYSDLFGKDLINRILEAGNKASIN